MPGATCKLHGPVGYWQVCEHLVEPLRDGTARGFRETLGEFLACEACFEQYGLARFQGLRYEQWDQEAQRVYYDALGPKADLWCHQCVLAIELAIAREAGLPDPFRAFERTATWVRRDLVEQIKAELRSNFTFRPSIDDPQEDTLYVGRGLLDRPLTITVYYVLDPETQDRIQACVERCLEGSGLPEYHLVFKEAEVWIPTPEGGFEPGGIVVREVWGG